MVCRQVRLLLSTGCPSLGRLAQTALLALVFLLAWQSESLAATIFITNSMNWSAITTGSGPGGQPDNTDDIFVERGQTLTVNVANGMSRTLRLGSNAGPRPGNGTLRFNNGAQVTVAGLVTVGDGGRVGSIDMTNGGTLIAQGFVDVNLGSWRPGTGTVQLTATNTLPNSGAFDTFNNLIINGAGTTTTLDQDTTVSGTLTLASGILAVGANTLFLDGPTIAGTPANLLTTSASSLSFGGSSPGVIVPSSVTALNDLIIDNPSGVTLSSSPTINGVLDLTNGTVTTGNNTLKVATACDVPGVVPGNGYVIGNLQLTFPPGGATCTYDVGTGTTYAPMTVTTPSGGTLTGTTIGNEHPQIASSGIDSAKDANRYWTLWVTGDTMNAASYDATFNFITGDLDATATPTSFVLGKYTGNTWTLPKPVTATGTSTGVTGIAGPLNSPTGFVVGEAVFVCSVPAGLPAGMTCVCDNFGRSAVNPSTIFGGDYSLTQSSGTPGWPKIATQGFLQMTNNSGNMATSATLPGTFPAAGNLITVEFKHYAYNGTGADGIALTLSDAAIPPAPGAYGGSLGFAQKTAAGGGGADINGFAGGWVGIGLDEFGNFSNPTEGRSGGPGFRRDSVAIRGSGSGLTGYPYLGGTGTLAPGIDNTAAPRAPGYTYRIMVDARCYQLNGAGCGNPALARKTAVSVDRDTAGGTSYTPLVPSFDAYAANPAQVNVPANWKLSFTGSTGGSVNIHELAGLKVCAQSITPPAGYRIQIDNLTPSTCGTPGGSPSSPIVTITALDSGGNPITTYNKTINLLAALSGGGISSATWRKVGAATDLPGNQYTFVAADNGVARFYLTDTNPETVTVSVSENGSTVSSTSGTPIQYSGSAFNIVNIDPLGADVGGGVVAGRSHLFSATRTNGCSINIGYTGTKNLDGWYTPAVGDHPTGANAPLVCAPNAGGTCLPSTGACQTLSIAAPAVDPSSNNMPALTFARGVANFCLATTDVGKYSISLRDDTVRQPAVGSSGTLTARPFAIAVSNVKQGAINNPANNTSGGTVFANAGTNFAATVGGYLWNGAGDANNDGLPDPTADFSQITGAGLAPRYADTVTLGAGKPFAPATPLDSPAGTGTAGALSNGAVAVTNGSNTQLTLSYNEVGTFSMTAAPATGYLNSGVNLANRVAIFSNPLSTAQGKLVGRFKPDHFALSGAASIDTRADLACSPASIFTYMGEPMNAKFTLVAQNYASSTTQNYAGPYAKLALSPASAFSFGAIDGIAPAPLTPLTNRLDATMATTGNWVSGSAAMTVPVALNRKSAPVAPDGPYDSLKLGIYPQDAEGVTLAASALNLDTDNAGGNDRTQIGNPTRVRFGRLTLSNSYGSELLKLPLAMAVQSWNSATGFTTNSDDSCTAIAGQSITMNNYRINLSGSPACETTVPASVPFSNGTASLILSKPGAGNNGSVDLTVNLGTAATGNTCAAPATAEAAATFENKSYLQGNWSGSNFQANPAARATFGLYKSGPAIYLREMY